MKEYWWPPQAISYTKSQIIWIIENIAYIRQGVWPPECRESGYAGKNDSHSTSADFEPIMIVLADIERRLEKCGQDGYFLELVYGAGATYEHISKCINQTPRKVEKRVQTALRYICGKKDKANYQNYKNHKKGE
jgi:hypothetical protein